MNWMQHNAMTSKFTLKREFLRRKLAKHEHTPARDIEGRARNRRMAQRYRDELAYLEAR